MPHAARELRLALRTLARNPGFSFVAILTIAVAIGACTLIYTIVHGVLIRPLPYPQPDRLVQVWQVNRQGGQSQFSDPNFEDLRDGSRAFARLAQYTSGPTTVLAGETPLRTQVAVVSADFFDIFGVRPVRGRSFGAEHLSIGAEPVVLVAHAFWTGALGASEISAAAVQIGGERHTVIGVLPPGFTFPEGVDIWMPREAQSRNPYRTGHNWRVVGRLGDVSLSAARADVSAVARRLKASLGDHTHMSDVALVPLHEQIAGPVRRPLTILLAAVACLLLIACANIAHLLVVHMTARRRELAVRAALGAPPRALAYPAVAEAGLLAAAGGLLGLALGAGGLRVFSVVVPATIPRASEIAMDLPVVLTMAAVTGVTAAGLAAAASWGAGRGDLADALKSGARGGTVARGTARFRSGLVITQLAISIVLLTAAGLLGRSLAVLLQQDPGFRTEGVLTVELSTGSVETDAERRRAALHEQAITRFRALPGVSGSGGVSRFPLGAGYSSGTFLKVTGEERMDSMEDLFVLGQDPSRTGDAEFRVASGGYFRALGIPLRAGRLFEEGDTAEAPQVAVISESLAKAAWPGDDPIGRLVQFGGMDGDLRPLRIVGIVGDIRERGLDAAVRPTLYAEYRQRPRVTGTFTLVLHTEGSPAALVNPARAILRELNPEVAPRFRPAGEILAASVADRQFSLLVIGGFAAVALLLAVVGIYGVLSYVVTLRTQEFGVRMALGASRAGVWRLVLRQAAVLIAAGAGVGLALALMTGGVLSSMLYGITPTDPVTLAGVLVVLAAAAFAACQVPAWRATRANPLDALRSE